MSISLVAVGDISFGDHFVCTSFGVNSFLKKNPDFDIFEDVKHILKSGDIVFGNLETVLSNHNLNEKNVHSYHMRGKKEYVSYLVNSGFNVINIANNHILQHGDAAFYYTVNLLERNNIKIVGIAERNGLNSKPCNLYIQRKKIVFLGYAFEQDKYYKGTTLYAFADENAILADIKKYKKKDNILICSFHWGNEFIYYPSRKQINFARRCINAGCDLILGHHPHVINGMEIYNSKLIFYSLGNFVFDQLWNEKCTKSMIIKLHINNSISIDKIFPIKISNLYKPELLKNAEFCNTFKSLCSKISENSSSLDDNYLIDYMRLEKENRFQSWQYLIKNIYKYDVYILVQILYNTLKKKLSGF